MKEQFCTYEIALKLKELGFDEECFGRYETENYYLEKCSGVKLEPTHTTSQNLFSWQLASAPLWQQAIDWLWEEHKILVFPYWVPDKTQTIMWVTQFIQVDYWSTKDQAILKAIELITPKQ